MSHLSPQLLIATTGAVVRSRPPALSLAPDPSLFQPWRRAPKRWTKDVALIQHCGYWSHYDARARKSSWPLPRLMTPNALFRFGALHDIIRETPEEGDIFLQVAPRTGMVVHAGIVVTVLASGEYSDVQPYFDVYTYEGGTDECARVGGSKSMRVRRRLFPEFGDCFLRWRSLA